MGCLDIKENVSVRLRIYKNTLALYQTGFTYQLCLRFNQDLPFASQWYSVPDHFHEFGECLQNSWSRTRLKMIPSPKKYKLWWYIHKPTWRIKVLQYCITRCEEQLKTQQ